MKIKSLGCRKILTMIGICTITLLNTSLAFAQEGNSVDTNKITHSVYGGPFIDTYKVNGSTAFMGGFMVGWTIEINGKHRIGIEPSIKRLINKIMVQENNYGDLLYLHLIYAGIGFSYTNASYGPVSFTLRNTFSTGLSNYHFGNFETDLQSGYTVFAMEPGVLVNYRFSKNFEASAGLTYNMVAGSDHFLISSDQLSGMAGTIRIRVRMGI